MNSRRLSNGNGMDVSDVFMSDPFLSLDDDLDDVSGSFIVFHCL